MEKRGQFRSKFGFIMASVGSAVGLGNLWGFPYKAGMGGGFAFIVAYLCFVALVGIPVMMCEFSFGRKAKANVVTAYKKLDKHFGFTGYICVIAVSLILGFYAVLGGWIIRYTLQYAKGLFGTGKAIAAPGDFFGAFTADPVASILFFVIFMAATIFIVTYGVEKGIEKASKIMMPALFVCLLVVIIRSVTLPGASAGFEFLFKPDISKLTPKTLGLALSQMFFSCSLGVGTMLTYGSYLSDDDNIQQSAVIVPLMDTMTAILAGIAIFPAVFALGLEPAQGPALMFISLPSIFNEMAMGDIFGFIFFVLVLFAALTSSISMLEVSTSVISEHTKLNRKTAAILCGTVITLIGIPVALSFGELSHVTILGMGFLDFYDFLGEYIGMTIGALVIVILAGWVLKTKYVYDEIEQGGKFKVYAKGFFDISIKFIAPVLILVVMITNVISMF
ncbi:MAG: sodium-dependent transporter [Oscillospiraceae bacterium]|nr:sodium-dependent transporter [Oscillospiraceae bacterium]